LNAVMRLTTEADNQSSFDCAFMLTILNVEMQAAGKGRQFISITYTCKIIWCYCCRFSV